MFQLRNVYLCVNNVFYLFLLSVFKDGKVLIHLLSLVFKQIYFYCMRVSKLRFPFMDEQFF